MKRASTSIVKPILPTGSKLIGHAAARTIVPMHRVCRRILAIPRAAARDSLSPIGAVSFDRTPALLSHSQIKISPKSSEIPVAVAPIDDASGSTIGITVKLPPSQGDLLGFFRDLTHEGPIPRMGVYDPAGLVTDQPSAANAVWKLLDPNRWGYS